MSKSAIPPTRTIRADHLRLSNTRVVNSTESLSTAYAWLKSSDRNTEMGVLSDNNRRTLLVIGHHTITTEITLDTDFVDIIGNGGTIIEATAGTNGLLQTAKNMRFENIKLVCNGEFNYGLAIQNVGRYTGCTVSSVAKLSEITVTKIGIGLDAGLYVSQLFPTTEVFIGSIATTGWYKFKSIVSDDAIKLVGDAGSGSNCNVQILCHASRYENIEAYNKYTVGLLKGWNIRGNDHIGGLFQNIRLGNYGLRCDYSFANYTVSGAVTSESSGTQTGIPITGHPYSVGDRLQISNTTNYNWLTWGRLFYVMAGTTANKIIINAPYVEETLSNALIVGYSHELRAKLNFVSAGTFSIGGDHCRDIGGEINYGNFGDYAIGACSNWGSPVSAKITNTKGGILSVATAAKFSGQAIDCEFGSHSISGCTPKSAAPTTSDYIFEALMSGYCRNVICGGGLSFGYDGASSYRTGTMLGCCNGSKSASASYIADCYAS
jgi:hypothetical protein